MLILNSHTLFMPQNLPKYYCYHILQAKKLEFRVIQCLASGYITSADFGLLLKY